MGVNLSEHEQCKRIFEYTPHTAYMTHGDCGLLGLRAHVDEHNRVMDIYKHGSM